ncbi:MAG: hypothetical protein R2732_05405 [Microbacteriaceae bacterium]
MIPVRWGDATLPVIEYLRAMIAGTVTRTANGDPRVVVVDTEWQQLETDLSRRCTVLFEARVTRANGTGDTSAAVNLAADVLYALQQPIPGVIRFDQPIGPRVVTDPEKKFEYAEGSIVLVFSA